MRKKEIAEIVGSMNDRIGKIQDDVELVLDADTRLVRSAELQATILDSFNRGMARFSKKHEQANFLDHVVHAVVLLLVLGLVWLIHENLKYLIGMCKGEIEAPTASD